MEIILRDNVLQRFNLGQLQPPFVLSLSKHERHTSTSSVRAVTL
ncbi:hypothetical protein CRENPOLYSF1_100094 [Crenothrix polyspora]|uniref:Uncharacterized protein n=1 Tax=Crenothrix polyspora TaxID=360316 RepID=A0A1R4GZ52_9GAMM|nr:hypothetical protein CRENPOLYSF1_100094 [Crenothrix polyspora]